MSGFKFELDENAASTAGGNGGGITTGVHEVKITGAYLETDKSGNPRLDLSFENEQGSGCTIYGIAIDKTFKNGSKNYDYAKFQELAQICKMKTGETAEVQRPGKEGALRPAIAFVELMDKQVQIAVHSELDVYNNNEEKRRRLYRTFDAEGKSVTEIKTNKPAKDIEWVKENIQDFSNKAHKKWIADGNAGNNNTVSEDTAISNTESDDDDLF